MYHLRVKYIYLSEQVSQLTFKPCAWYYIQSQQLKPTVLLADFTQMFCMCLMTLVHDIQAVCFYCEPWEFCWKQKQRPEGTNLLICYKTFNPLLNTRAPSGTRKGDTSDSEPCMTRQNLIGGFWVSLHDCNSISDYNYSSTLLGNICQRTFNFVRSCSFLCQYSMYTK